MAPLRSVAAALTLLLFCTAAQGITRPAFDHRAAAIRAALMVDPAAGLAAAREAEGLANQLGSARDRGIAIATVQRLEGEAYVRMDDFGRAAPLISQALKRVRALAPGSKLEADILLSSGSVHSGQVDFAAALRDYQAAHHIYQSIGDMRDQAVALLSIGTLYGDASDNASALKYLDQAMLINGKDAKLLLSIYHNRASTLQELGRYAEAEQGYRKALVLAEQLNSPLLQARILGNIARVRLKVGDVDGATVVVDRALAIAAHGDAATWRPQLVAVAAQAAYQRHDLARAAALVAERFRGVDLSTTSIVAREAHQTAYDTYRALGDANDAILHLAALKRLDDQATRLATSANSALAAARFDFANQELRLATLQRDDANRTAEDERQRARTQRLIFLLAGVAGAIVTALLATGVITLRRSRNTVRAVAADLATTNQALGKALAARTEFLATTSHEIRTPLNGILGMTEVMLADGALAPDLRERLAIVHGAGTTMRALVDDILDVAKIETGNLTIERAPFDLRAIAADAAKLWENQARERGIGFVVDLADCPGMVEGDVARVRQIIFNLLSNAMKFTLRGEVKLSASCGEGKYRLAITDTGIGIAADHIDTIFESFRQADAGTTRRFGGTGLGLAICRSLARAMGGDVTVDSVVGRGSTFTIVLPMLAVTDEAKGADAEVTTQVLVVDANPIARAMIGALVAGQGASVRAVASIDEALAGGSADHVLVDQSALVAAPDPAAALARLGGRKSAVALLWTGDVPPAIAGTGVRVIAKPIAGAALVNAIFETISQRSAAEPLVQRAA